MARLEYDLDKANNNYIDLKKKLNESVNDLISIKTSIYSYWIYLFIR